MKAITNNQSVGMKGLLIIAVLACSIIAGWTLPAFAENNCGNINLAQLRQFRPFQRQQSSQTPQPSQQTPQNFSGKIDEVAVTAQGTSFYISNINPHLLLFASGECRDALLQAFFRKANVSIIYELTTTDCNPGEKCGKVTDVGIQSNGF